MQHKSPEAVRAHVVSVQNDVILLDTAIIEDIRGPDYDENDVSTVEDAAEYGGDLRASLERRFHSTMDGHVDYLKSCLHGDGPRGGEEREDCLLTQAHKKGDLLEYSDQAHKLLASARNLGFERTSRLLDLLEKVTEDIHVGAFDLAGPQTLPHGGATLTPEEEPRRIIVQVLLEICVPMEASYQESLLAIDKFRWLQRITS